MRNLATTLFVYFALAILSVSSIAAEGDERNGTSKQELLPIPDKLVVLTFDDANKSDRAFVADILKQHDFGATFYVTEGLGFLKNKQHYTTWKEVRELHDMGFEIGNHTHGHCGGASIGPFLRMEEASSLVP